MEEENKQEQQRQRTGGPRGRNRGTAEKPKDMKKAISRLTKELGKYKWLIFLAVGAAIVSSIISVVSPKFLSKITDEITKGLTVGIDFNALWHIGAIAITLYVISIIARFMEGFPMVKVANTFANDLRRRISVKINKLPLTYFDKHKTGDILSRITNDVDTLAQALNQSLASFVESSILFLGTIIMMFVTNPIMAISAILSCILGLVIAFNILRKSQKYFDERQIELGKLNGHIEESYSGMNIIKVYNGKGQQNEKFDELNNKVYEANRKSMFLSGIMQPLMNFTGNLGYIVVCIVGALLVQNGKTTFGTIVAFMTYVRLFTQPLQTIAQSLTSLQTAIAASERIFEFVDEKEMENEDNLTDRLELKDAKGAVEFKNVKFKYSDAKNYTIKDFSAKVNPGEKIAIVGPTGAGKTTLVNLLMKFYNIDSGDILIDGHSIKKLTRENIHELFTMVLQDTWIFNGTLRDNIKYNSNATDEQINKILDEVGLTHYVHTLPKGLDTVISDSGEGVSVGQKQLITIARAMTQNTPFLILDEATSNVDTRTEELVQNAMDSLAKGKTSFIIAHRLSTIKNANLILVVNGGKIIEQGTHEELLAKNGFYASLYNSQFTLV